jgi:hypothetical protein
MPREGVVNNFHFDKEVFTDYMQEQSLLNNALIASGVVVYDPLLDEMVGGKGNVGTIPFFSNIDNESDALNDDGKTDNVPTELEGKKQTFMAIARMKAWKEKTYTRYLTGKSPLHNLANNLVVPYWKNQWEKDLMATIKGVMGLSAMSTHKTDVSVTTGTITDANKIDLVTHLDLGQKAKGDKRGQFTLFVCHSKIATNYKKLEIIENKKYFIPVLNQTIELPVIGNMIVLETDTNTIDTSVEGFPVYHSYMLGRGAFLTTDKQVHEPYNTKYDPETDGGVEKLYTKQAKVLHPDGFSIKIDNIIEESPTRVELATSDNWELKVDNKLISIAEIISNG